MKKNQIPGKLIYEFLKSNQEEFINRRDALEENVVTVIEYENVVDFKNLLIQLGYFTPNMQPSKWALKQDLLRYNDGSKYFKNVSRQPAVLFTIAFMAHFSERFIENWEKTWLPSKYACMN